MHNKIVGVFLVASAIGAAVGCGPASYGPDPYPIMSRYDLSYQGECSSWLYSQRSGKRYCASPPLDLNVSLTGVQEAGPSGPQFDESKTGHADLMAAGEKVYSQTCAACHQADGKGTPGAFPPLAGAGEYYGAPEKMATIIAKGLSGEIEVLGQKYDGVMPPQVLTDYEIAAVATFVRNSFGNSDGDVAPADVAAVR